MNTLTTQLCEPDTATNRTTRLKPELGSGDGPNGALPPRWKRILVPVDFSLESMKTVSYASQLAEALGASLCLIHVLGEPSFLRSLRRIPNLVSKQELVDAARTKLLAVTKRKVRAAIPTVVSVRIGELDREILAAAARVKADALILHTDTKRGLKEFLHNGVTRRVVQGAPCPTLLIPRQVIWESEPSLPLVRPGNWRNFLVPIEMSAVGEQTLSRGFALAKWFKARLTAFNVVRTGQLRVQHRPTRARNRRLVEAKGKFEEWVTRRVPFGVAVESYVGVGKTVPTFLQAARHLKAHLIVVGTQQFAGWRQWRAACAMSRILNETPCPILAVPQRPGGGEPCAASNPVESGATTYVVVAESPTNRSKDMDNFPQKPSRAKGWKP